MTLPNTEPTAHVGTNTLRGFVVSEGGLQIPGPHTQTYMMPTIDAPVFDRRSSADPEPKLPINTSAAP